MRLYTLVPTRQGMTWNQSSADAADILAADPQITVIACVEEVLLV
jgi:hypothetical protein